ncbi:MAG TPA: UDP-glucose 4-epimerase GalE [Candidatus Acidoferrales bacterium]|nr:UDP-glucose 4-epimerase GalE [Candidatus Acidoferrales bacterium]
MAVLVTGGGGYIGSVTVEQLRAKGEAVVVLDDLFRGHRSAVASDVPFYQGRAGDRSILKKILSEHEIEACVHFAALAYVGESVEQPARYFENNVEQGVALITSLLDGGVRRMVFSSTCATYGEPEKIPISEDAPQWPTNPYGWTKLTLERMLQALDHAHGLKFVALRYFNAAGATERSGEHHDPETHLVPNVLKAASGKISELSVYGKNYPTPDGTAIRDYVHVADLADAHILALDHLRTGRSSDFINLGTGHGYSVMEVIECGRKVTGRPIPIRIAPPRPGDPAELIADASKAAKVLGWRPKKSDLATILRSQWEWQQRNPNGYDAR